MIKVNRIPLVKIYITIKTSALTIIIADAMI